MIPDIIHILEQVKTKLTDESDMLWTSYETPGQLRTEIEAYITRLQAGNTQCLYNINILFLPTADLQEHSLMNGWSAEYLQLAAAFDSLYEKLK